jgi:hypothetical protein
MGDQRVAQAPDFLCYLKASREIKLDLIHITPAPAFAGLDRFHDRVFHSVEVFCRVLIL